MQDTCSSSYLSFRVTVSFLVSSPNWLIGPFSTLNPLVPCGVFHKSSSLCGLSPVTFHHTSPLSRSLMAVPLPPGGPVPPLHTLYFLWHLPKPSNGPCGILPHSHWPCGCLFIPNSIFLITLVINPPLIIWLPSESTKICISTKIIEVGATLKHLPAH